MKNYARIQKYIDNLRSRAPLLANGSYQAQSVLSEIEMFGAIIYPDDKLCGLSAFLSLEKLEIRGESIWTLYHFVCDEKLTWLLALLRAEYLEILSAQDIYRYLNITNTKLKFMLNHLPPVEIIYNHVRKLYPNFDAIDFDSTRRSICN